MPFMPVTKRMATQRAARRKTLQGYEVKSLGTRYDAAQRAAKQQFETEQQGLLSGYQQQVDNYAKQLGVYEQQLKTFEQASSAFQAKADEYNAKVNAFNTVSSLPGIFAQSVAKDRPKTWLDMRVSNKDESNLFMQGSEAFNELFGIPGVNAIRTKDNKTIITGFDAAQLPSQYVLKQVGATGAGYLTFELQKRGAPDPGQFTESFTAQVPTAPTAPGAAPDTSGLIGKYTESLKKEQDVYEREIGERKLAAQRARRRTADRPLLAGESV